MLAQSLVQSVSEQNSLLTSTANTNTHTDKNEKHQQPPETKNNNNLVLEFVNNGKIISVGVKNQSDLDNKELRKELHEKHDIPITHPVFKPNFAINTKNSDNLENPENCTKSNKSHFLFIPKW